MPKKILISKARKARKFAYAPYSHFEVGAALMTQSVKIFTGLNIENASYSNTLCAERVAIFNAVSVGETSFSQIVVIADTAEPISPCGSCRQVMVEFFTNDVLIHLGNLKDDFLTISIEDLLPNAFS